MVEVVCREGEDTAERVLQLAMKLQLYVPHSFSELRLHERLRLEAYVNQQIYISSQIPCRSTHSALSRSNSTVDPSPNT